MQEAEREGPAWPGHYGDGGWGNAEGSEPVAVLLLHVDDGRVVPARRRRPAAPVSSIRSPVAALVDGYGAGRWSALHVALCGVLRNCGCGWLPCLVAGHLSSVYRCTGLVSRVGGVGGRMDRGQ